MKTFRLLLVGVLFLLITATMPTPVQAAGQFVGYLPLLSHVDPNISVQIQSRNALRRLMPRLLVMQKNGVISEFEPELWAGVLKVKYSAVSGLSTLSGVQIYTNVRDAMVNVPHTRSSSTLSISASGPSFLAELYDSCFQIANLEAFSHVVGSLRDKTGRAVATYEGDSDGSGDLFDCFSGNGSFSDIVPGYKLTFKVYDSTPVVGTYVVVAPSIQFTTIDKSHAIVRGKGPAGKLYDIEWSHPNLDSGDTSTNTGRTGKISSTGTWAKDFGTRKIRGGDSFEIFVQQNSQFTFFRTQDAPAIYCQFRSNYCDVSGIAFQPATLSIMQNGVTYRFAGKFSACGCFSQVLEKNGDPIYLKAGDKVSGTAVAAYRLPNLTIGVDFNTDMVSGKAPGNKYFELWVNDPYVFSWYFVWAHSNSLGNYSGDFSSQVDLVATQAANIEVFYQDALSGNTTDYFRSIGP